MAITTYAELKTAAANWLHRDDLTTYIPDFIAICEATLYREIRIRAMEVALSSAISSGVVAVPSDYIDLKSAYVDGSPSKVLERTSPEVVYAKYPTRSAEGKPSVIAREGTNFIFGPYPDSAYTIKGIYYKRLAALSDANTTNWVLTNAPDVLLYGSLLASAPFLKNDSRIGVWASLYSSSKNRLQEEDTAEQHSGSSLRSRAV